MSSEILIAEDEYSIALSLKFLMEQAGYAVRIANDGQEALDCITARVPDLLLLDINMPRLDGYQVCEKVRENANWQSMRVVMLTAKGRDIEREKGLAAGADDYITKPFATQDVVDRVAKWLAEDRMPEQAE